MVLTKALWLEVDVDGRCFTKGEVLQECVRSVFSMVGRWQVSGLLFSMVVRPVKEEDLAKLERNDIMVRWMCNVTVKG